MKIPNSYGMKSRLQLMVVLFSILIFFSNGAAQDFLGCFWGDSIGTIKAKEIGQLIQDSTGKIIYKIKMDSVNCAAAFYFTDGILKKGIYIFDGIAKNPGQYNAFVNRYKGKLLKKYGRESGTESGLVSSLIFWRADRSAITLHYFKQMPGSFTNIFSIEFNALIQSKEDF